MCKVRLDVRRWRGRIHPVAGWCATRSSTVDHGCGAAAVRRSYASVWPQCGRIGARPAGMAEHGNDQREKGLDGGEYRQAAGIAGKTPMGKWAFIIEPLLRGLESEIADRQGLIRSNIDNKIRETEQIVSESEPQDINERREDPLTNFCASYAELCDSV